VAEDALTCTATRPAPRVIIVLEIMLLPLQFAWISIGVPSPVMTLPVKVFDDDPDMSRTPVEAEPFIEIVLNERVLRLAPV
jgi:hypothetical protein